MSFLGYGLGRLNDQRISISLRLVDITMAPHSSTLAWKIPWTEEPGRLQSMGSLGVGYDWVTSLWLFTFMHWRRKWQPTLAWRIPGTGEPGGLPSLGSHRVGHDWSDLAAAWYFRKVDPEYNHSAVQFYFLIFLHLILFINSFLFLFYYISIHNSGILCVYCNMIYLTKSLSLNVSLLIDFCYYK